MCKILQRIKTLADNEGITITALERNIGASKGVISRALNQGSDIQTKWLLAIVEKYPQYSGEWLLSGTGSMLTPISHAEYDVAKASDITMGTETRPRIPFEAAAGGLSVALNGVSESECEQMPVIASLPRYDFTIFAHGNSMQPDIISGDEIACAFVKNSSFIQWGRTHVLDTAQGVVVKRIFDDHDMIICKSTNPDYPDFTIPKNEIYHMAIVVGLIRHF